MIKKMTIAEIKKQAELNMVKGYFDDKYYINFELEDGGYGSFEEFQSNEEVEVYYD